MIRTQIYLDEEIHKDLSHLARRGKESMAKVARDILKEGIQKRTQLDKSGKEVLKKLLAMKVSGGPTDLSENLDYYLYGGPKKKKMNRPRIIFVDADAFIAFTKQDDSNHKRAQQIFEKLQDTLVTFITSNFVFAEVVTVLSQRVNHEVAVTFINNLKSDDNIFQIERINEETEEKATQIFIQQTSKNVSFIDCTNIALIRGKNMDGIFSFDAIYKKNGFKIAEELIFK